MSSIVKVSDFLGFQGLNEGAGTQNIQPFKISRNGSAFNVRAGVVNNVIPNNIFVDFPINLNLTYYVYVQVFSFEGSISYCTIGYSETAPEPFIVDIVPPSQIKILLGMIIQGTIIQILEGNITASIEEAFKEEKLTPLAHGESPYIFYWTWNIITY